jgi:hypothetical protein
VSSFLSQATDFNYDLYWIVDGYIAPVASASGPIISGSNVQNASDNLSFDLSGLAPQSSTEPFFYTLFSLLALQQMAVGPKDVVPSTI